MWWKARSPAAPYRVSAAHCWRTWSTTTTETRCRQRLSTICCRPPPTYRRSSTDTSRSRGPVSAATRAAARVAPSGPPRRDQRDQRCARSARRDAHAIAGQPCRDRRIDRTSTKGPLAVELTNEFRVAVPAAKTWEFLTDVERVAPCLPGATMVSVDGDEFTGAVKV